MQQGAFRDALAGGRRRRRQTKPDIIPKFWEADVRRVEGIALWALTRFEKAEIALLRALEVLFAVVERRDTAPSTLIVNGCATLFWHTDPGMLNRRSVR